MLGVDYLFILIFALFLIASILVNHGLVVQVHVEQKLRLILLEDVRVLASTCTARLKYTKGVLQGVFERVLTVILTATSEFYLRYLIT